MLTALEILQKYWQHDQFRPLQAEIIDTVLSGQDTFAILPTGGGKSICYQVPAMLSKGICLVISPLVALMKDQVANLQEKGIKAIALTGGIPQDELINLLDNCQYGNYKFLYLSPERLQSDWVFDRIKNLDVNLIAIDEAHCVSQWGYDFRPSYLNISVLKDFFPKVPFIALTATATSRVKKDIVAELGLKEPKVFQQSFARKNLAYMVFETQDKLFKIQQILKKNPQPSIIYVRNRKACIEIANQLQSLGFAATYYHGGLRSKEKEKNMALLMQETAQVIVATNAFGMGIDKPNVKTVIHIQLPDTIENYYQEAGRVGRNGDKAFAVLLTSPNDQSQAQQQFLNNLPDTVFLKHVYKKINAYYQIPYNEGMDRKEVFNLNHFCQKYNLPVLKTYNGLQFLDRQGILTLSQEYSEKNSLQFLIPSRELIQYTNQNPVDELIVLTILRTYPGIYENKIAFNSALIAKKSKQSEQQVEKVLAKLKDKKIIDYQWVGSDSTLVFNQIREDDLTINRVSKYLESQNKLKKEQLEAVLDYVKDENKCRSILILNYFEEKSTTNCGICSYCIAQKSKPQNHTNASMQVLAVLEKEALHSRELQFRLKINADTLIFVLQELLEKEKIVVNSNNTYSLKI